MTGDTSLYLLIAMAFALGIRHGFDLDHLATIDAITRHVKTHHRLARWTGFLFSLGHGLVVIVISAVVGGGLVRMHAPLWLEAFGNWVSIICLLIFGSLTLWNIWPHSSMLPVGFKSYLFQKLAGKSFNPWFIAATGALFAFSFDTFTQVALFSMSASVTANTLFSIMLGMVFMLGMIAADGCNGVIVSMFIRLADQRSCLVSRIIGLLIAGFSLVLGLNGLVGQLVVS
ncbi:HoxN/HupN/NixA family nickel/cobalt transporter [Legionella spiritensis]|nr:DNA repair protein [Legionella spiritensis]